MPRTSRTSASSAATGSWASSARATSPPRSRWCLVPHEPSTWPRRAPRGSDLAPSRWAAPRPAHRSPMGTFDRQASWTRRDPPAHAPSGVHHGGARRRCPATRRSDRCPPRRPTHDNHLRPATSELRPSRRLGRRRLRRWRLTGTSVIPRHRSGRAFRDTLDELFSARTVVPSRGSGERARTNHVKP